MHNQSRRQQLGTKRPPKYPRYRHDGSFGKFGPQEYQTNYDTAFRLVNNFMDRMLPYGLGADRMIEVSLGKGETGLRGIVDLNARERQAVIDEYERSNDEHNER